MVCESWKANVDMYLDGELSEEETRRYDAHERSCASCSGNVLARVQTKRAVQVAGRRFTPSADFRKRLQQSIAPKPRRSQRLGWYVRWGDGRHSSGWGGSRWSKQELFVAW